METDSTKRIEITARLPSGEFKLSPEVQKDMSKMLSQISDLERKNLELGAQIKSYESKNTSNNNIPREFFFIIPEKRRTSSIFTRTSSGAGEATGSRDGGDRIKTNNAQN